MGLGNKYDYHDHDHHNYGDDHDDHDHHDIDQQDHHSNGRFYIGQHDDYDDDNMMISVMITIITNSDIAATCVRGNGRFYLGEHNTTKGGLSCQPWYTPHPHQHTSPPQVLDGVDGGDDHDANDDHIDNMKSLKHFCLAF